MAGIYIHIPFCRQACTYCDFHFTTSLRYRQELVEAICREIGLRKHYLPTPLLSTLYFGGGTPSLLSAGELERILEEVHAHFQLDGNAEITLEANPDDLRHIYLQELRGLGINRLSIGIQSFRDADLRYMNRVHSAQEALACTKRAAAAGFEQLSIDLIYGTPGLPDEAWEKNLRTAAALPVNHLSCYSLTIEEGTPLAKSIRLGKSPGTDEEQSARQFELLQQLSPALGFEQYEISNFCREGRYAIHNTAYWQGKPYLGIGPSAHSFDGISRRVNVANNQQYIRSLQNGDASHETELLTPDTHYNELVLTRLRTKWGLPVSLLETLAPHYTTHFHKKVQPYITQGLLQDASGNYRLSPKGMLLADRISQDLFITK